ncbi:hypothetical protein B5M42_017175 [Paenibacillus athensensis]|uniref:hypothetical protein n=1 Tax=Paenibacillus athensensis TaxID=1967502 RepID=UPI00106F4332|nr:hypothetical protein [Paenibacillus athensensis]MCD1260536.1 hypothetical protein [Paenibacillus athensensis]
MSKHVKVKITWVSEEMNGKKIVPVGKYSTAARFRDFPVDETWSVIVISESEIDASRTGIYDLCFLFGEDAPEHLLYSGHSFYLIEGRKVAEGVVI